MYGNVQTQNIKKKSSVRSWSLFT